MSDEFPTDIVELLKAPLRISHISKNQAWIADADNRIVIICYAKNADLIVNAVNAYNNLRDENARLLDELRIAKKKEEVK